MHDINKDVYGELFWLHSDYLEDLLIRCRWSEDDMGEVGFMEFAGV